MNTLARSTSNSISPRTGEQLPVLDLRSETESEHFVQFYEDDDFLVGAIARFAREGLAAGETVILIATAAHRAGIDAQLTAADVNLPRLAAAGRYLALDASETLARFMVDGAPEPVRFGETVGALIANAAQHGRVRAFGEMVAMLSADGATEAALKLESLWNELARRHLFTLFCAYPLKVFGRSTDSTAFLHVCGAHKHVIPAESYDLNAASADRLRAMAILQQKAAALEAEIEERKRAEAALRRQKEELSAFVENASIGLHWVGPDGIILWANAAEMEMLGYDRAEYIGHHVAEFHADQPVIDDILGRLCKGERLRNYEARLRCKSGAIKTVLVDSSVLWDNDRFVHTQCFTRDVTEQKRTEQQLAAARDALVRANEELEHRVFERTASLREAIAQLEEFSYTVSHDLRAPLRGMQVYSQALLEDHAGNLDTEGRHCLQRISENASRLDRMITDVLAFSRVSRSELQVHRVPLARLVAELIEHNPSLRPPRAILHVEPLHDVLGHEPFLEQALSNLLSNAVKFVAAGNVPSVRIWDELVEGHVRLWIEDNGIGIPPAVQSRLFRMFERLHPGLPYEGTGIGLAIVRKAVTRMRGDVGVEPNTPKGSRFWIRLPAA